MKYKVLKEFIDLKNECVLRKVNEVIDITEERAEELKSMLGENFIEKVEETKKTK